MNVRCQYKTHTVFSPNLSIIFTFSKKCTNVLDLTVEFVVPNELKSAQVNLRVYHDYCSTPSHISLLQGSSTSESALDEKKSVLKYLLRNSRQGFKYCLV